MHNLITSLGPIEAILLLICLVASVRFAAGALLRLKRYAETVSQCGYLPPPPTPRAVRILRMLARMLTFVQVGRIKVIGRENLDKAGGPIVVTPNHPHWADVCVMPIVMNRPARYMAARGVFTFAGGLGGTIVGPMGAFAADLTKGKGAPAREAAVTVVAAGEPLVIFPEGWAYLDGVVGEFKKGAVRIAREARQKLGEETFLVPVFLRYGKYPGAWIRKLPPIWEYLLVLLLFPLYRRGCTVVVGEPVAASSLPDDAAAATEKLKEMVLALDPLAE